MSLILSPVVLRMPAVTRKQMSPRRKQGSFSDLLQSHSRPAEPEIIDAVWEDLEPEEGLFSHSLPGQLYRAASQILNPRMWYVNYYA